MYLKPNIETARQQTPMNMFKIAQVQSILSNKVFDTHSLESRALARRRTLGGMAKDLTVLMLHYCLLNIGRSVPEHTKSVVSKGEKFRLD